MNSKKDSRYIESIEEILPKSRNRDFIKTADNLVNDNIFTIPPFGEIKDSLSDIWQGDDKSRSLMRLVHGHSFLGCLSDAFIKTKNIRYLEKGTEIIKDWIESNPKTKSNNSMAYHDETTALRLQYWLRFYILCHNNLPDKKFIETLREEMLKTAALLADENFHSTNTNHGMFQDMALLCFSIYFNNEYCDLCESYCDLAIERLKSYLKFVFTSDGVHKEQSPVYHMLVTANVKRLAGFLDKIDKEISLDFEKIYKNAEEFATHIIRPDGHFPPICDTEPKSVTKVGYRNLFNSDQFLYSVSAGAEGKASSNLDSVFKDAGYAIFRDSWELKEKSTYVLFTAAYNSDYHKHSDDLNLYIYSDGEIITEAGPNGYNYNNEFTKYAYSSNAHNTLLVDGKGLPRVDGQYDKVYLKEYNIHDNESSVIGVNKRFEGVTHTRKVNYQKDHKVINVLDTVESNETHEYRLLWHVSSDIKVFYHEKIIELFRDEEKIMEIEFDSKVQIRTSIKSGQEVPYIQGWEFPEMEKKKEHTTLMVDILGENVECSTTFRMSDFKIPNSHFNIKKLEKVFHGQKPIRYLFEESKSDELKDKLIIVFTAMAEPYRFVYNYLKTLEGIPANKLFILDDFGDQGSYYIGKNRDFSIDTSVSSLIDYILAKNDIKSKNVISIGSSKGGYAAIYFGIKKYFGNIIAGAPQSKLGDFLISQAPHKNIATYISGDSREYDRYYLNEILFNLVDKPSDNISPNFHITVGDKDHHYKNHVLPLRQVLDKNNYVLNLEVKEGITHSDLKVHFPNYLLNQLQKILNYEIPIQINSVSIQESSLRNIKVTCIAKGDNLEYAYYIFKDEEVIEKIFYTSNNILNYHVKEAGTYMVRVYVRNKFNKVIKNTNTIKVN